TLDAADDLTMIQVIEAVEGPTADGLCVLRNSTCNEDLPCALHDAWVDARRALVAALGRRSVFEEPIQRNGGTQ
ncbi:MAG: hypothetical protein JJE47_03800, partial [Acidimicrobiia bacterium]|nr:hypothetical protein [Acidimicrobiia bacterium]